MPETGRLLIGMVAGFKSERWPVNDRNGGRLQSGIRILHTEIRDYLTKTLRLLGQPGTMRQMLQKQHTQISGSPMTETELDELTAGMKQRQAEGVDVVQMMYGMGLLSITEDEFRARHDKSYEQFEAEMVAFNNRPDRNDTDSEAIIPNHDAIQRNTSRSIQS